MSKELEEIKRDYRKISAPPHLATRVRAELADRPPSRSNWAPLVTTALAVASIAWMLPFAMQQQVPQTTKPTKPSLSALAALKPDKPTRAAPSLSRLRSVSIPSAPSRPTPKITVPRSWIDTELKNDTMEETNHVHS